MKRFKAPKKNTHSVRLPESIFPEIAALRASMERATDFGGLRLNPDATLRDSVVLGFAVGIANMAMSGHCAIIDRKKFLETLDREVVRRMPEFAERTDDERRAMLGLIFAGCSEFSSYDASAPLRAVPPDGGEQ